MHFQESLCIIAIAATAAFPGAVQASYSVLKENLTASAFFSGFNFFTAGDLTGGFVKYIDRESATSKGLIRTYESGPVYIGVDFTSVAPEGRESVRLESVNRYEYGLFILDALHMPEGCGVWPAFWTVGPSWPAGGEVDILEGVNLNDYNSISLHTSAGCTVSGTGGTGQTQTTICDSPGNNNAGCGVRDTDTTSYGAGFNKINGGVYAMEWTSQFIKVWFFPRPSIPADALGPNPAPENWGLPRAAFSGSGCDISSHFNDMQIVFNNDICGDWAGGVWGSSSCHEFSGSCTDYATNNASAFFNAYWLINSLRVFIL